MSGHPGTHVIVSEMDNTQMYATSCALKPKLLKGPRLRVGFLFLDRWGRNVSVVGDIGADT